MENWLKQVKDNWNETADSDWYRSLRADENIEELVKEPASAFHPSVHQLINKYMPELRGKKVLLPSSGDNHAAFAFALLGAEVTSADISEKQLEYAKGIADRLNLDIRIVCDDTTQLSNIEDNSFDLVYTSNGTHTWIADI
ncbi:MAG: class I SAM-dependent methyltransferase, partial [Lachnospiraceae bacterium]|nr:class I SAM-dependent methyltransferase [Lachnospiraceae bacterium]